MLFPLYDFNPHSRYPFFTILLIVANLLVMLKMSAMNMQDQLTFVVEYGFIPARLTQVDQPKPVHIREDAVDWRGRPIPGTSIVRKVPTAGHAPSPTMG